MLFADVILPLALPKLYTYSVPPELAPACAPGKRVVVQFGKKKLYAAIVRRIHQNQPQDYQTKNLLSVLDEKPLISQLQFGFWDWIADYYLCTTGEIFKAALPAGLKLESETQLAYNPDAESENALTDKELQIVSALRQKQSMKITELHVAAGVENALHAIQKLINQDIIQVKESLRKGYKVKTETCIRLAAKYQPNDKLKKLFAELEKAPKQLDILMTYLNEKNHNNSGIRKKDLTTKSNASTATLKALVDKGVFQEFKKTVSRLHSYKKKLDIKSQLNEFQAQALQEIEQNFAEKNVTLLHGVTSSGKTEIYIHLIEKNIAQGKQVLYLLPEIALTAQIINRLKLIFGDTVGIYHSRFNDAERVEIWREVENFVPPEPGKKPEPQKYQVILGVRSSIFLPFSDLGLIIVDEEHENTYKQFDPAPRYHARDAAIVLAGLHKAKTLLGTATPALETYHNAKTGKYALVDLKQRFKNIQLPEILTVDVKDLRRRKQMKSHFSPLLLNHIKKALDKHEQVILFQNRRGFSPSLECKTCGWVPKCKYCDVSLTYHKHLNHLVCHYCGYTIKSLSQCLACGDTALRTIGFGTEKIEDEIEIFFPEARVRRMDFDSTRTKKAYENIIAAFETRKVDILIGTQMISKGLDFNNVSVVGIMNADNMLNFPDFRAYERSFQLMTQVSGRAGRKNKQGLVIIQTSSPKNVIVRDVIANDYAHMFAHQMAEREKYKYPPFYRLIRITLKHKKQEKVNHAADWLAANLRQSFGNRILGPEFPPVNRVQNWYQKNILVKIESKASLKKAKTLLSKAVNHAKTRDGYKSLQIVLNVDPL